MIDKPPICPHCGKETEKYDVPPWDGVSWGVPFLYVCFNDECPLFVRGQKHLMENYGQVASYRYMVYPDTGKAEVMASFNPVFLNKQSATSQDDSEEKD